MLLLLLLAQRRCPSPLLETSPWHLRPAGTRLQPQHLQQSRWDQDVSRLFVVGKRTSVREVARTCANQNGVHAVLGPWLAVDPQLPHLPPQEP